MNETASDVITAIRENRERFIAFCSSLTAEQVSRPVPDSTWLVQDFVAHLATLDPLMEPLFLGTAQIEGAGATAATGDFDVDAFNDAAVASRRDWPLARVLDEAATNRERLVGVIAGLTDEQVASSMHFSGDAKRGAGTWPMKLFLTGWAQHDPIHVADMLRALPERAEDPELVAWLESPFVKGYQRAMNPERPAGVIDMRLIAEGREAEIFAWEDGRVLRLFRDTDAASRLQREATAMRAVRQVVPLVPEVFGDTVVDGRPGLIMERIDGVDLITAVARKPWLVWHISTTTGRAHAEINGIQAPPEIEPLHDRLERLIRRSDLVPDGLKDFALRELLSLPGGTALCHGDLHPGNILDSPRGPIVIDWANVARGDATADFARSVMMGRLGSFPAGTPRVVRVGRVPGIKLYEVGYVRAYRRLRPVDMRLVARWQVVRAADRLAEGIPEERAPLLKLLERARGANSQPAS